MPSRRALPVGFAAWLVMASPAAAAPTITADMPCYTPGMVQHVTGSGFTPSGPVELSMHVLVGNVTETLGTVTTTADAAGAVDVQAQMPRFQAEQGTGVILAIDETLLDQGVPFEQATFSLAMEVSQWQVAVQRWRGSPPYGKPGRRTRIDTIGWVGSASTSLYAHYVRGRRLVKTARIGKLTGACGDFAGRMREFPFKQAKAATYRVVFDTTRAYPNDDVEIVYRRVKVRRKDAVAAAAAIADPIERLRTGGRVLTYR